jgi:hypothetical protein
MNEDEERDALSKEGLSSYTSITATVLRPET